MHLIQIFLPLHDNTGTRFPRNLYKGLEQELISRFTGFTAYPRMPASGLWKDAHESVERDELVIYEVLTDDLDRAWWRSLREKLEHEFKQEKILMRSQIVEVL
jgi:hypothetical protein